MKLEKFIAKMVECFRLFSVLCAGAMVVMLIADGIDVLVIVALLLSLILFVCTSAKIKEDKEQWDDE